MYNYDRHIPDLRMTFICPWGIGANTVQEFAVHWKGVDYLFVVESYRGEQLLDEPYTEETTVRQKFYQPIPEDMPIFDLLKTSVRLID